jgi:hypothetical protein
MFSLKKYVKSSSGITAVEISTSPPIACMSALSLGTTTTPRRRACHFGEEGASWANMGDRANTVSKTVRMVLIRMRFDGLSPNVIPIMGGSYDKCHGSCFLLRKKLGRL